MREISRILKANGRVLLSVPYSRNYYQDWQRHYDEATLEKLVQGFLIERKNYYVNQGVKWIEVLPDSMQQQEHGLACLVLKKEIGEVINK